MSDKERNTPKKATSSEAKKTSEKKASISKPGADIQPRKRGSN